MKFSIFAFEKNFYILHGHVFVMYSDSYSSTSVVVLILLCLGVELLCFCELPFGKLLLTRLTIRFLSINIFNFG